MSNLAKPEALLADLRHLIDEARAHVAQTANSTLTMLYWRIGKRLRAEALEDARAEYGKGIVSAASRELASAYGSGFSEKNLWHCLRFVDAFADEQIVSALSRQLSWTHFRQLIYLDQPMERDYYAEMCRLERWSTRTLRERIDSQLYLRTALSKKPESVIDAELKALRAADRMTPDLVFRDPYMLDFLGLADGYSERDLETAILREMERFLLELGVGFTFVARQKRITVGRDDFHLDLLFYHRYLRRLVAVELKLESFRPAHKGQMELYLRWLDRHERAEGEESPLGLILCASADSEQVELMALESAGIRVAEYLARIPDMKLLQAQLHRAVEHARERAAQSLLADTQADGTEQGKAS